MRVTIFKQSAESYQLPPEWLARVVRNACKVSADREDRLRLIAETLANCPERGGLLAGREVFRPTLRQEEEPRSDIDGRSRDLLERALDLVEAADASGFTGEEDAALWEYVEEELIGFDQGKPAAGLASDEKEETESV